MGSILIPFCCFPTTILWMCDNLESSYPVPELIAKKYEIHFSDSPYQALSLVHYRQNANVVYFNPSVNLDKLLSHWYSHPKENKLRPILEELQNPGRFQELSVLIIHYNPAAVDGLRLSQYMKNDRIKKILLSDPEHQATMTTALKKKQIDRYFIKNEPDLAYKLDRAISKLQLAYFLEMSELVRKSLGIPRIPLLEDKTFSEEFTQLRRQYHISEYYLLDTAANFLLLTESGGGYHFCAKEFKLERLSQSQQLCLGHGRHDVAMLDAH